MPECPPTQEGRQLDPAIGAMSPRSGGTLPRWRSGQSPGFLREIKALVRCGTPASILGAMSARSPLSFATAAAACFGASVACQVVLGIEDDLPRPAVQTTRDGAPADASPEACAVDTKGDPANCGACGRDCLGGSCTDGACGPSLLFASSRITELAADGEGAFWSTSDGLFARARTSRTTATLYVGNVEHFAIDAAHVYFTDYVSVRAVPRGGGDITFRIDGQSASRGIAVDDANLYWMRSDGDPTNVLTRANKDGRPVTHNETLHVAEKAIYFFSHYRLNRIAREGGVALDLPSTSSASSYSSTPYASDGKFVYFLGNTDPGTSHGAWRLDIDTLASTPVLAGRNTGLALDGDEIYLSVVDEPQGVVAVPKGGGASRRVLSISEPSRLAFGGGSLYVVGKTDAGQGVHRVVLR